MMNDDRVIQYAVGLVHCSVCAPNKLTRAEILALTPEAGTTLNWQFSDEPFFADAKTPNPCPCEKEPGRTHYLLVR